MAKLTTERIVLDGSIKNELDFRYDVNINKDGTFNTTLPKNIVKLFEDGMMELNINKSGNSGYLTSSTLDGLNNQVSKLCKEYMSKEVVSETIVLKYSITTNCQYTVDDKGNIFPNQTFAENLNWMCGTMGHSTMNVNPFSLSIYVKPFIKTIYKFRSSKEKTEYINIGNHVIKKDRVNLIYLNSLVNIGSNTSNCFEIEYDELVAKVFVDMIKGICKINEQIKEFINPEGIKYLSESNQKLIS